MSNLGREGEAEVLGGLFVGAFWFQLLGGIGPPARGAPPSACNIILVLAAFHFARRKQLVSIPQILKKTKLKYNYLSLPTNNHPSNIPEAVLARGKGMLDLSLLGGRISFDLISS